MSEFTHICVTFSKVDGAHAHFSVFPQISYLRSSPRTGEREGQHGDGRAGRRARRGGGRAALPRGAQRRGVPQGAALHEPSSCAAEHFKHVSISLLYLAPLTSEKILLNIVIFTLPVTKYWNSANHRNKSAECLTTSIFCKNLPPLLKFDEIAFEGMLRAFRKIETSDII